MKKLSKADRGFVWFLRIASVPILLICILALGVSLFAGKDETATKVSQSDGTTYNVRSADGTVYTIDGSCGGRINVDCNGRSDPVGSPEPIFINDGTAVYGSRFSQSMGSIFGIVIVGILFLSVWATKLNRRRQLKPSKEK